MAALPDFTDTSRFPTFATIPEAGGEAPPPPEPWYLLARIKDDMTITKPTLVALDRAGSPFALLFEGFDRDGIDLKGRGLKKGATVVVPRALRTPPATEGKRGFVRVDKPDADSVKAIPGPLERVLELGSGSGSAAPAAGCSSCGADGQDEQAKLAKCTGCGRARYCGKDCQVKGWNEGHKGDCKIYKALDSIFSPSA
ncbi:hypothetical protein RB597_003930 [Gaeumannomyces tritici]